MQKRIRIKGKANTKPVNVYNALITVKSTENDRPFSIPGNIVLKIRNKFFHEGINTLVFLKAYLVKIGQYKQVGTVHNNGFF